MSWGPTKRYAGSSYFHYHAGLPHAISYWNEFSENRLQIISEKKHKAQSKYNTELDFTDDTALVTEKMEQVQDFL